MSASSNYNAITNLTETVIDYLVVDTAEIDTALIENLDCNVGTIDTLTSTTATLTSANIPTLTSTTAGITTANITTENTTTSNTTNLKTNNIQANPNSSAITIYTSHTGEFNLGNTSNTNGIRMNNKLQMATDKQIEITPTGHLACETIRGYSFGNPVSLYLSQTGAISFGNNLGTGGGITINDNITLPANRTITLNASGGKVLCNVYTGTTTSSNLTIGESGNTGTLTIYKTIASPTISGTLSANDIQGTTTSSAITLFTLSSVSSPTITLGNVSGGTFTINPNTTMNGNLILASGKTISLNATGGKIICNTYEAITTGGAVSLFGTGTSGSTISLGSLIGNLTLNPNTQLNGNLILASSKTITLSNVAGSKILCDTYTGTATNSNLTIGETGNTGTLTIHKTAVICQTIQARDTADSVNLFINHQNTFNINSASNIFPVLIQSNLQVNATKKLLCNVYTGTETSSNLTIGQVGDTGTLTIYKTIAGTLSVNDIQGSTTSSAITLFTLSSVSSPTITLGNLSGGTFSINPNTTMNGNLILASSKTISLNATGGKVLSNVYTGTTTSSNLTIGETGDTGTLTIYKTIAGTFAVDTISATTPTSTGSLFNNIVAGAVGISTSLTGSMNIATALINNALTIGNASFVAGTNTGSVVINLPLTCNQNLTLTSGKTLSVNDIQGTTTSSAITLFTNSSLSSPTITLGNLTGGVFTINPNTQLNGTLTLASGKNLTLSSTGNLICNTLQGSAISSTISLYANITAGIINIGTGLASSSSLNIATLLLNGVISIGNSSFNPATNIGYVVCHMPLYLNQDFNLATGKNVITSSTSKVYCNVYTGTSTSSNLTIGESGDTGNLLIYKTITTGNTYSGTNTFSGGNTHSGSNTFSGATNTFNNTLACNTFRSTAVGSAVSLFSTTTAGISIGGSSSGILLDSNVSLGTGDTLTTSTTGSILCPTYNSTSATQALSIGTSNTTTNVSIATGLTTGSLVLGSNNVSSKNYSAADLYIQTSAGSDRTLYGNTIRATTYLGIVQGGSLYSTTLTQDLNIGAGLTTGNLFLSNLSATTGYVAIQSRFRQTRTISAINLSSFWNVALGSANNIFQSAYISTFAFPPIFTSADTFTWSVWESNAGGEGSFIAQNGETTVICNPGDQSAFHWQDEDSMGSASGFKFSTAGVMSTSSDRRLKRDINPIPVGSDLLDKLSLIEYVNYKKKAPTEEKYYKNGKLRQKYQDIHKGLIAQDVKKIFPEVVEKEGEYHMMKYAEVDIYFNMGVQELIKRDKEKQIEIDELKNKATASAIAIDDLTARLVRLEQILLNP